MLNKPPQFGKLVVRLIVLGYFFAVMLSPHIAKAQEQKSGKVRGMLFSSKSAKPMVTPELEFDEGQVKYGERAYSEWFYAVLLGSRKAVHEETPESRAEGTRCDDSTFSLKECNEMQKSFPDRKVFASRNGCYGYAYIYEGTSGDYNFIAVFAAVEKKEAETFLTKLKTEQPGNRFAGANLRRMRIIYDYGD